MNIVVRYMAQLRQAAGMSMERVDVPEGSSLSAMVIHLTETRSAALKRVLLCDDGSVQPSILLFVNDAQVADAAATILHDGDEVIFLTPIAGGS